MARRACLTSRRTTAITCPRGTCYSRFPAKRTTPSLTLTLTNPNPSTISNPIPSPNPSPNPNTNPDPNSNPNQVRRPRPPRRQPLVRARAAAALLAAGDGARHGGHHRRGEAWHPQHLHAHSTRRPAVDAGRARRRRRRGAAGETPDSTLAGAVNCVVGAPAAPAVYSLTEADPVSTGVTALR